MMMKNTVLCLIALFLSVNQAHADNYEVPPAYRVGPLEIKEVVPTQEELYSELLVPETHSLSSDLKAAIDWGTVVLIGEKVVELVKQGKPVVNLKRDAVAVIPQGLRGWEELSGWQSPATKVYSVTAKNYLGLTVIDLRLKVSAMYGGGVDGRGKYLSNVIVVPSSVYVMWGFSCDVWTENRDPVNTGSKSAPVAGLGFDIRFKYGNALSMQEGAQDYFVKGDGTILENP